MVTRVQTTEEQKRQIERIKREHKHYLKIWVATSFNVGLCLGTIMQGWWKNVNIHKILNNADTWFEVNEVAYKGTLYAIGFMALVVILLYWRKR